MQSVIRATSFVCKLAEIIYCIYVISSSNNGIAWVCDSMPGKIIKSNAIFSIIPHTFALISVQNCQGQNHVIHTVPNQT